MQNDGFILWEVLFSMVLLAIILAFISEGWLTWKKMDSQAEVLGRGVFLGQKQMEVLLETGKGETIDRGEKGFKIQSRMEPWENLHKARVKINWEQRGNLREMEFITLHTTECIFRGKRLDE